MFPFLTGKQNRLWTLNQSHWILSLPPSLSLSLCLFRGSPSGKRPSGGKELQAGRWEVGSGQGKLVGQWSCWEGRHVKGQELTRSPKPLSSLALWDQWDASRVGLRGPSGASLRTCVFQAKCAKDPTGDGHSTPNGGVRSGIPMLNHSLETRSYQKTPRNFAHSGLRCQLVCLYFIMIIIS